MIVGAVIVFLPWMAQGQTLMGSVTLKASVRDTVALAMSSNSTEDNVRVVAENELEALTVVLSGTGSNVAAFRVPVLIRSNINYVISTLVQSQAVTLANFAVLDVRPTGRFVAQSAVANLKLAREVDRHDTSGSLQTASLPVNASSPFAILSGPRVSLSGTLNSADNALEVTFLITVKPDIGADNWLLRLTLSGSAENRF